MKVMALIEAPNHVCYRYRLAAFASELEARGWALDALPLSPRTLARTSQLRSAHDADVVILQRKLLPFWQLRILRKAARVLVYDFDDAIFHRDWHSTKGATSWQRLAHFWATIHLSDGVIAGNRFLQEQAGTYVDPAKVHLVPTCINPELYPAARHSRRGAETRLVWIGQQSTLPSLAEAETALSAASRKLPGLELRVICDAFPEMPGTKVVRRVWSEETEGSEIADADVGVSWLPDHPWSLGKCALKVLQYMAAGLPVVANPIGIHATLIVHGKTGFLASTPAEWADAISILANDPALRNRMGQAAREMVTRNYSIARWAPELTALIGRWSAAACSAQSSPIRALCAASK